LLTGPINFERNFNEVGRALSTTRLPWWPGAYWVTSRNSRGQQIASELFDLRGSAKPFAFLVKAPLINRLRPVSEGQRTNAYAVGHFQV
jgi:hypothetical protein